MTSDQAALQEDQVAMLAASARIGAVAELQAIILRELKWSLPEVAVPNGLPISLTNEFNAGAASSPTQLFYRIHAVVKGVIPDGIEIFSFEVTFQLVFTIPDGAIYEPAELQAFGSTSVMFMVFPYIREALQDTAGRAGMPVLLQPLRVGFTQVQTETNLPSEPPSESEPGSASGPPPRKRKAQTRRDT